MVAATRLDSQSVRRAYARWAPVYDMSFANIVEAGRRDAIRIINERSGSLLDVGVGTGIALPDYARHLQITGVDLSPDMLEKARERVAKRALSHIRELREMDAGALEFPDASFDTVVAFYVMTVVPDARAVMAELERVVKPGGQIFIVNHFAVPTGVRGRVERFFAPASKLLGWHPDLPVELVTDAAKETELVEHRSLKPLGFWSMLRFEKPAEVSSEA